MKEHLLTLFLALTTALTIIAFSTISNNRSVLVTKTDDLLFLHQTVHGNFAINKNLNGEIYLSLTQRGFNGFNETTRSYGLVRNDTTFLMLTPDEKNSLATFAVISQNDELHEIIVFYDNSPIAHHAHAKKTTCDTLAVFLIATQEITSNDVLILGLNIEGEIIFEIQNP